MRAILATLLCMSAAHAGDSAFWGETGCQLVPIQGQAWVAEARCINRLTSMAEPNVNAELQAGDLVIGLSVMQTPGRIPDEFAVTPPPGYVAEPPVMVLDEDAAGVVRVFEWLGF